MELDNLSHEREAESQSAVAAARRGVRLAEAVEQVWKEFATDPLASVPHNQLDRRTHLRKLHVDPAARLGEFDRVRHEIPNGLLQAVGIGVDGRPALVE